MSTRLRQSRHQLSPEIPYARSELPAGVEQFLQVTQPGQDLRAEKIVDIAAAEGTSSANSLSKAAAHDELWENYSVETKRLINGLELELGNALQQQRETDLILRPLDNVSAEEVKEDIGKLNHLILTISSLASDCFANKFKASPDFVALSPPLIALFGHHTLTFIKNMTPKDIAHSGTVLHTLSQLLMQAYLCSEIHNFLEEWHVEQTISGFLKGLNEALQKNEFQSLSARVRSLITTHVRKNIPSCDSMKLTQSSINRNLQDMSSIIYSTGYRPASLRNGIPSIQAALLRKGLSKLLNELWSQSVAIKQKMREDIISADYRTVVINPRIIFDSSRMAIHGPALTSPLSQVALLTTQMGANRFVNSLIGEHTSGTGTRQNLVLEPEDILQPIVLLESHLVDMFEGANHRSKRVKTRHAKGEVEDGIVVSSFRSRKPSVEVPSLPTVARRRPRNPTATSAKSTRANSSRTKGRQ